MGKKLSVIRFKPKPEHYEAFLNDVIENGKDRDPQYPHFCVRAGEEVIAVVIRDSDNFEQSAQEGVVNWLDERRQSNYQFLSRSSQYLSKAWTSEKDLVTDAFSSMGS